MIDVFEYGKDDPAARRPSSPEPHLFGLPSETRRLLGPGLPNARLRSLRPIGTRGNSGRRR